MRSLHRGLATGELDRSKVGHVGRLTTVTMLRASNDKNRAVLSLMLIDKASGTTVGAWMTS